MSRPRLLDDDTAEQLYQDYCAWLAARREFHPKKLAAKYGVNEDAVRAYGTRRHKRRAA